MTHWSLNNVLLSLQLFEYFLLLLLLLSPSFIALWLDSMQGVIQFSYICWDLLCALLHVLFWWKFHGLLRTYIILLQDGILCRHLSVPLGLWCYSVLEFVDFLLSEWPLCWWWMSIKVFHHHCVGVYLWLKSFSVCFMKLGAPTLSACQLMIVISSWSIAPFVSMIWPSLSLLTILIWNPLYLI
jgi:hypothetical protein